MKNIIKSFFNWIKRSINWFKQYLILAYKNSTNQHRKIFFASLVVFCVSAIGAGTTYWIKNTIVKPTNGGKYIEGIVLNSNEDLTETVNRLTKIGLTRFDENGDIKPEVATSWEIIDDVKTYIFTIDKKFSRDDVLKNIEKQKDKWAGIVIESKDDDKIVFKFNQSYSPFLASTTSPVLPYGPYNLVKDSNTEFAFEANQNYYKGRPYLDEIVIKIYPNQDNLLKAYKAKQIDGVYKIEGDQFPNFTKYSFDLQRYTMLFFNTQKDFLKDKETRKKIADGQRFDSEVYFNLVVLDNPQNKAIVDELLNKWKDKNIKAQVFYKTSNQLISDIIPKRDYDLLLYGLNYGVDPDPYPFWHSTQASERGLNLSNFSNIEADKALEAGRLTINKDERNQKYDEFWKIFNEEKPAVVISQDKWTFAVSPKIKGVKTGYSTIPEDRFLFITDWFRKSTRVLNK